MSMFKKILIVLLSSVSSIVLADDQNTAITDLKKPVHLRAGQPSLTLRLPSNATTGYSWFLGCFDHHLLTLKAHRYIAPKSMGAVGVGGVEEWIFAVSKAAYLAPQKTEIHLQYMRGWELPTNPEMVVTIVSEQNSVQQNT